MPRFSEGGLVGAGGICLRDKKQAQGIVLGDTVSSPLVRPALEPVSRSARSVKPWAPLRVFASGPDLRVHDW